MWPASVYRGHRGDSVFSYVSRGVPPPSLRFVAESPILRSTSREERKSTASPFPRLSSDTTSWNLRLGLVSPFSSNVLTSERLRGQHLLLRLLSARVSSPVSISLEFTSRAGLSLFQKRLGWRKASRSTTFIATTSLRSKRLIAGIILSGNIADITLWNQRLLE